MSITLTQPKPLMAGQGRILVIDDEPDLRTLYELSLSREGYSVLTAASVAQALEQLCQHEFDLIVSDMQLPDGLGLDVLRYIQNQQRRERCLVITAYGSAQNAVEALKAGAFDYLTKPVDLKQFRSTVAQAFQPLTDPRLSPNESSQYPLSTANAVARSATGNPDEQRAEQSLQRIVGSSVAMRQVRARIARVAQSMAPVFIQGESGTGKELVARAVHACSHRANAAFVAVNCSAIPDHLLEAEFFGVKKGAFTGAVQDRIGFFQAAHGGTLFLDEIGDLPLSMQAKLLRAIQERRIRCLGDSAEQEVNVRLLSATHKDLPSAIAQGQFRQDLFYRLHVIDVYLPPLRERKEDITEMVHVLLKRMTQDHGGQEPTVSAQMMEQLRERPWYGNVRELENTLHRALALSEGSQLNCDADAVVSIGVGSSQTTANSMQRPSDAPDLARHMPHDLQAHLDAQEKQILIQALQENGFNRTAAAARLGISLRQIRYRMARLGVQEDSHETKPSASV